MEVNRIKKACTETLVISLLKQKPMHGYQMCKEIERRSAAYFSLKHSTLYPILHRLEKEGLIAGEWVSLDAGKPKKHYHLTPRGEGHYRESADHWRGFIEAMIRMVPEAAL